MPVYEGSLHDLMRRFRAQGKEVPKITTERVFLQILLALHHIHTHNPPIIHRDVKPLNILHRGENFFLTDFGIAKVLDTSRTYVGTDSYIAPEVRMNGDQTPKVDIYSLGATIVECLEEFPHQGERPAAWEQWHQHLRGRVIHLESRIEPMLSRFAHDRPTARQLLDDFFPQWFLASLPNPQTDLALPSFEIPSPITNEANRTRMIYSATPTPMEWTRAIFTGLFQRNAQPTLWNERTQISRPKPVAVQSPEAPSTGPTPAEITYKKPVRSTNERRKKRRTPSASPRNKNDPLYQSAGVSKRTSSSGKRRSRSKSILKAQEIRTLGMT